MRIAYLTAGGAGMYCGSCLRDNALAAALLRLGEDVLLLPTYTPITTDETDVSSQRVFLGGINIYLRQRYPLFRFAPRFLRRWLDRPGVISWLAARGVETDARLLGALTVSMLRGERGAQRSEIEELIEWLATEARPDIINLTNLLIAGFLPGLKRRWGGPVIVTLQGDDLFIDDLPEPFREEALALLRGLVDSVDGFVVFSRYYGEFMREYLDIPAEKIHVAPMGIEVGDFGSPDEPRTRPPDRPPVLGYLARICPEKGFHQLVDAFLLLASRDRLGEARLHVAGWLSEKDREFFREQVGRIEAAGLADRFHHAGVLDRAGKIEFLRGLDVLSVPTVYREPKGLFVLEALASGVPVVLPAHGAFPELVEMTGGGLLFEPGNVEELAGVLEELLRDRSRQASLAEAGRRAVHEKLTAEHMARRTLEIYRQHVQES